MFELRYNLYNRMAFDKYVIALAISHPFLENADHRNPYLEDKLTQDPTTFDFFLLVWPRGFHKPKKMKKIMKTLTIKINQKENKKKINKRKVKTV